MNEVTEYAAGRVHGFLHRPSHPTGEGLVLTHGAGGNSRAPLLVAIAEAFAEAGIFVLRFDLPFRQRRPHGPPSPATAADDRTGIREAAAELRTLAPGRIFLGGHSYGGRQTTMLAAEEPQIADALLLFSYPLHPPNQPAKLRTAHFPQLRTPAMFVHGSKDGFGSPQEMQEALALIPAPTSLAILTSAGHDLSRGKFDLKSMVVEPFEKFVKR